MGAGRGWDRCRTAWNAAVEAFPSIDQGTDCTWMKKSQIPEIYWQ